MKRKLYSFALACMMMLAGQTAWADLQQNENGAYLIGSKDDLQAWTEMAGYESTDVVLTDDIEGLDFMLCTNSTSYSGVFDGQGHTITLNYDFEGKQTGMFYNFAGTVKNLIVGGYIKATYKNCAGLAAWNWSDNARFENVASIVSIDVDWTANTSDAGFIGYAARSCTFVNCLSAIKVKGNQAFNHGFAGWVTSGKTMNYVNCISIAEVETMSTFSWGNPADRASHTNCYCLQQDADAATAPSGVTYITYDMVTSGELCFKANGDQSSINWYQTLGQDAFPLPFSEGHEQVYAVGEVNCAGVALGEVTYSNTNDTPTPKHNDVDGWCSVCGQLMQDHITPNADGFLELGSVADVEWFAAMVNDAHQTTINGLLTADIDYQGEVNAHTPIGLNTTFKYNGTFDGGGHRIKNMIIDGTSNFQGFFGIVRGATVIRNLIIDSSCEITGPSAIGGITGAAQTDGGSPLVIENCVNEATVVATSGSASGILGVGQSAYPTIQIKNCLNTGSITGAPATAFCAWINKGGSSLTNCVNIGEINGADLAKFSYYAQLIRYEPGSLTMTNCYDFSDFDDQGAGHQGTDGDWLTDEPLTSGELCFTLNGDQSVLTWNQRLGTDAYPVPYYIEGGQVYAGGELNCDGTPIDVNGYSNSPTGTIPPHEYEDGFCVNCGKGDPDYAPLVDDFRMIGNASQLYWFSRMVNEFGNAGWNARLTEDIDMTDYNDMFEPIGNGTNPYRGHFDGQQHRISELHINTGYNYTGFIGRCGNGAFIENLLLDETCSINTTGECAGFVGGTYQMNGTVTLRNLGNMGNVYAGKQQAAGIFGANTGSQTTLLIENCFSTGAVEGGYDCGALAGWAGSGGKATINNCWSCSEVTGYSEGKNLYFARVTDGHLSNNYCTSEIEQQVALIGYEEIMDGTLCYKLNGDQSTIAWFQNLDNDAEVDDQPLPFSNGHAQVYPKGKMLCDGTVDPSGMTYSNNNQVVIPDHQFEDGFCTVCGQEDSNYTGFLSIIKNANFTNDSNFWTGTTSFAVNNGVAEQTGKTFDTHQDITDLENGVYKLRLQGFSRAAALDSEAYEDYQEDMMRNTYYYAESAGKRQARRLVDITSDGKDAKMCDGVGEVELPNGDYVPATTAAAAVYMSKGHYWNKPLYLAITDGTLRIGLSNQINSTNAWSVIDRVRIEYVGNDAEAYALIAQQISDDAQNLEEVLGQETLKDAYIEIVRNAEDLTDIDAILDAADQASRLPDQIKLSVAAYESYAAAIQAIIDEWESRDDLIGDDADRLETYLTESEEPSDIYPNGSYLYIMENRQLNAEQLAAEIAFAQQLLQTAILNSAAEGSDLTSLIINPKFNDATEWNGWTVTEGSSESGYNMVHNDGFTDVFPVAAAYNLAFEVSQEITGLSDGIYALTAQAFYRPGERGHGLIDGTDIIPAQLFINDFATPVLSVYADKLRYIDALNGVNCRYDATEDESAPHNGEQTGRVDFDTQEGDDGYFVPDDVHTASFAFNGKRYNQTVYGIVKDGKLTLGIRNVGNPWHNKNLTVWGNFRLTYLGQNSNAIKDILNQYSDRVELLDQQRYDQDYFLSQSHIDAIRNKVAEAKNADKEKQMLLIEEINAEFMAVPASVEVYKQLLDIGQFASDMADGLEDGELKDELSAVYDEIQNIVVDGSLTDEETEQKIAELMTNPVIGGVVYVQGDLYDENSENGEWTYSQMCSLYPLKMNSEGKFVGSVTLQDRSRRANNYQRAGLFFRRINTVYKCANENRNFITPGRQHFDIQEGGSDFQALNGTYNIVLDFDNMTVDFDLQDEYNWDNAVFVTGTLNNRQGSLMRWKNDEQVPLQHLGGGKYVGVVDLVNDNSNPYCSFGIMACRSIEDMVNYSTTTRSSWTEARYGSETQYLEIKSGEECTDLVRGLDRTWRISPAGKYLIEFDMDNASMKATLLDTKGNGTENNPYQIANKYDLQGLRDRLINGKTVYAKLTADIDMQGEGWWPINSTFYANSYTEGYGKAISLDGTGHIIKNLTVTASKDNKFEAGFFGALVGSVKDLGFYNATVDGGNAQSTGILAGRTGYGAEEAPTTTISGVYVNGTVKSKGNFAAGFIGSVMSYADIQNCYTNAAVLGNFGLDMIGYVGADFTMQRSYSAGKANGSQVYALTDWPTSITGPHPALIDVLFYDGTNQQEICSTVSTWEGWNENGTIGNGWPLLDWQVQRGDYAQLCGFGLHGDVNLDGQTDIADAVTVLNAMAGEQVAGNADVNGDGNVDIADFVTVLNIMAGVQ